MKKHNLKISLLSAAIVLVFTMQAFAMASPAPSRPALQASDDPAGEIFAHIYTGRFDQAHKQLQDISADAHDRVDQLKDVIDKYQQLSEVRLEAKQQAYMEQLEKLDQLRQAFYMETDQDPEEMPEPEPVAESAQISELTAYADELAIDPNEPKDFDNPEHLVEAFSVILAAQELATEQQREELLNSPFVSRIFQSALDQAAVFEDQGQWLEAYINCYFWLQQIHEDNQGYEDYAQMLVQKANIVSSFQDSPCESSRERYEGVTAEIFTRSLSALQGNYVEPVNYGKMAKAALERSKMLANVLAASYNQIKQDADSSWHERLAKPTPDQLHDWSSGLDNKLAQLDKDPAGLSRDKLVNMFRNALQLNEQTVRLPQSVFIANFSEAALHALDPYTNIVWPRERDDFQKMMTNEFTGIGIEISRRRGVLTVGSLLPGTPAYRSGLNAQDIITHVDGVEAHDMSLTCAVKYITGPADTDVTLTVRSTGSETTRDITITRAKINVPTVRGWKRNAQGRWLYMIDQENRIGYIRLTSFGEDTTEELVRVLDELEAQDMQGLVLDLRFNSGGLLSTATTVANKFLNRGLIVSTRPRFGVWTYASADVSDTRPDYPLVVLINSSSASASEIVAGALADDHHKRAILVGTRTHGKGSVQGITQYPGGNAQLKYTMAYYHLPSGQRVKSQSEQTDDWGVAPHIEVDLTSIELRKMLEIQRQNDVLLRHDEDADQHNDSVEKYSLEETLKADPQMAVGILAAKTMLIEQSQPRQLAESD